METTEIKTRPRGLGGSMKPRNVQALVADQKELTAEVLKRYIRPEMNDDDVLSCDSSDTIPVIDMGKLMDVICSEEEASKLKHACEDWGFFQVVNHGVPEQVIEEIKDNIKGFFDNILTNGRYKSIEHRAVVNSKEERISIAAFHSPSFGRTVGPLAEIVGDDTPLIKSLSMEEYAKLFTSQKLDRKSRIELMKLNP